MIQIKPMLAKSNTKGERVFELDGYFLQEKIDGMRIIAIKESRDGDIALMSRSWKDNYASRFPEVVDELSKIDCDQFILDGELAFYHTDGKCEFFTGRITKETIEENQLTAHYNVFDILEFNNVDLRNETCSKRYAELCFIFNKTNYILGKHAFEFISLPKIHFGKDKFKEMYENIITRGGEGIILKNMDSVYKEGGRTSDWIKVKRYETSDFFICGVTEGTGKRKDTFGALVLGQYDSNGGINTVKCGTGFDVEMEHILLDKIMALDETEPCFNAHGFKMKRSVAPSLVCECKYMEATKKSVRHPVFLHLRTDKTPEQCIR